MEAAVQGADILVVAPTGMGKVRSCTFSDAKADMTLQSMCFQVPAVAEQVMYAIMEEDIEF